MSATLYVEGPDLRGLLKDIKAEHGSAARVVAVSQPRVGGVFGFFARQVYGVSYQVPAPSALDPQVASELAREFDSVVAAATVDPNTATAPLPKVSTHRCAEVASEAAPRRVTGRHRRPEQDGLAASLARAGELAETADPFEALLATADGGDGPPPRAPIAAPATPTLQVRPAGAPSPTPLRPPAGGPPLAVTAARARLGILSALRQVGVPVPLAPQFGETSLYRAVEQVVQQLPPAPRAPHRPGEILALIGQPPAALEVARALCPGLHIPSESVWVVDGSAEPGSPGIISGPRDAARRAALLRSADGPSIVVLDSARDIDAWDGPGDGYEREASWCAQVLAALMPSAVWAVVDATRKTADIRLELDRLGPLDAVAAHSVQRTASPATLWDLELPIALLDGRVASVGIWSALLHDVLRDAPAATLAGIE